MKRLIIMVLTLFVTACIDPINIKTKANSAALVVDGWITDEAGPYTVKLSKSIPYDNTEIVKVYSIPVTGAVIVIEDSVGISETLSQISPGVYQTQTIKGTVGHSYRVSIVTSDGRRYKSLYEELKPAKQIDLLNSDYSIKETLVKNANGSFRIQKIETFAIIVTVNDPIQESNFYRWQVDGIFEFFSSYNPPFDPDPEHPRNHCWAPQTRLEPKLEVISDENFNGKSYERIIATIIYDRPTKYLAKVRQLSLTERAHRYLIGISNQQTNTGTLFDPPPTGLSGNLICETDPDEIVLGYFGTTSIARKNLLIDRFKDSNYLTPSQNVGIRIGDCTTHEPFATNYKPEGF